MAKKKRETKRVLGIACERWSLENDKRTTRRYRGFAHGVEIEATRFEWDRSYHSLPTELVWHVTVCVKGMRTGSPYVATFEEADRVAMERLREIAAPLSAFLLAVKP